MMKHMNYYLSEEFQFIQDSLRCRIVVPVPSNSDHAVCTQGERILKGESKFNEQNNRPNQ